MTPVAQSSYPVVMGLEAPALAITQLVGVSGDHSPIAHPAALARAVSDSLKKFLVSVHYV